MWISQIWAIIMTFIAVSSDYLNDLSSGEVIILNASNPSMEISFSLVNDTIFELAEYLTASLQNSGDANQEVLFDPASVEIKIQDDDGNNNEIILTIFSRQNAYYKQFWVKNSYMWQFFPVDGYMLL